MIVVEDVRKKEAPSGKQADHFIIEWYEAGKTIIRRATAGGMEMAIRKNSSTPLEDGDILWEDDQKYVQVLIKPCECIVFQPTSMRAMGIICFEIGNRHIPIYIDDENIVSLAFEMPLYKMLQKAGFEPRIEEKKLLKTHLFRVHGR